MEREEKLLPQRGSQRQGLGPGPGLIKGDDAGAGADERPVTVLARKVALSLLPDLALKARRTTSTTAAAAETKASLGATERATVTRPGLGSACKPLPSQEELLSLSESLRSLVAVLGPTLSPCPASSNPSPCLPPSPSPCTDTEKDNNHNNNKNKNIDNNPLDTLLLFLGSDK